MTGALPGGYLLARITATYEIWWRPKDGARAIRCKTCHSISHNPNDVEERYCGQCHAFHEDATNYIGPPRPEDKA